MPSASHTYSFPQSARHVDAGAHRPDAGAAEAHRGARRDREPFPCAAGSASGPHARPEPSSLLAGEEGPIITPFPRTVEI